ncbi:protein Aatf [Manduca sexta]|uniref:protein Aatf n=1 Tax=Manduca sexta TaxID=7130 RepID=UPI00188DD03C|nr:protein Aatf [Manduca sexta]
MKSKNKKNVNQLLSDKIADALTLKPRADIEDDTVFGTKPRTVTWAELGSSDSEDEATISDFRKRNVNLLSDISKKYEGKVVTRKNFENSEEESDISDSEDSSNKDQNVSQKMSMDSSDDSEKEQDVPNSNSMELKESDSEDFDSDAESDDYSITKFGKKSQDATDNEESEDAEEDDDDGDAYDISQMDEPMKEDFEHVKKQNISEEAKKGICVRNQLLVWENLLEMRIHLQRCMNTANQMPMPDTYATLKDQTEFIEEANATKLNVANVLDKLLTLQSILFKKYPETKSLSINKQDKQKIEESKIDSDEEIPSDTDNEEIPSDTEDEEPADEKPLKENKTNMNTKKRKLDDYEKEIATTHKAFKTFRDTAIQKWNEKTRLATATNIKSAPTNTVLQQISYILSDREKLVRRTQLKRTEYDIIGYKKGDKDDNETDNPGIKDRKDDDEYIPEIFDDSDFYHQLLRELIECKSSDISDPVQLSRQWIALQQMRSKMKRKVDTKATKGRKIKYVVHNKLVNYMASQKCNTWTDESTNELFSSLFGKMFEHNNAGLNADVGNVFKLK